MHRIADADEDMKMNEPVPPRSACWDWPLSNKEKNARILILARQMDAMDRLSSVKDSIR